MEDGFFWWGYQHITGKFQAKRYFSQEDVEDAKKSDFVSEVYGPFEAVDREDALCKVIRMGNKL